jgi:SAM-dependent methyltransferase
MSDVLFPGRFAELAGFYTTGRPTYPRLLARRVADLVGLKSSHTVLDLGTGPGFLALDFHSFAGRVIGLDPEPAMLRVARHMAERAGKDIEFVEGSAADLGPRFGPLHLVTIGRAFHWMDRAKTLAVLDTLIEPRGAVALFHESYPVVPVNDWQPSFQAILDYYVPKTRRGNGRKGTRITRRCFLHRRSATWSGSPSWNHALPAWSTS